MRRQAPTHFELFSLSVRCEYLPAVGKGVPLAQARCPSGPNDYRVSWIGVKYYHGARSRSISWDPTHTQVMNRLSRIC